ncbi:carbohydrate ABC transporter permease [Haloarcula marina]|uniref:carbohydrate ABC transporter permease n=1 Tax=Haloarcula marina TaxID=2961574 RepID=UPI0020B81A7F|nr:sugar ABC transporter permease [Halomicroarcula marina]
MKGVWMSFHSWPLGTGDPEWVGLDNYAYLLSWEPFYTSLKATLIFATVTIVQLVLALVAALLVTHIRRNRLKSIVSSILISPFAMAPVVSGTIWLWILQPDFGPVFQYLVDWGILGDPIYWQTSGIGAMIGIMIATAFTFWPFMFIIILASLDGLPERQYEAARIFGANRIQQFRWITLPQLKTAIYIAVSLRVIWNLSKIAQPLQMTGGGPGFETSLLAVLLFRFAFTQNSLGLGYAVGMILLILVLGIIAFFLYQFTHADTDAVMQ